MVYEYIPESVKLTDFKLPRIQQAILRQVT